MPNERLISPAVFTREIDQTFLPQGIDQIAGAFVGPTSKGPAFKPVLVESAREYRRIFGNGNLYTDIAVQNYLTEAGSAWVTRLLGTGGYPINGDSNAGDLIEIRYAGSTVPDNPVFAVLAATTSPEVVTNAQIDGTIGKADFEDFAIEFTFDSGVTRTYHLSLDPTADNYIEKVFGRSKEGAREVYVKYSFRELHGQLAGTSLPVEVDFRDKGDGQIAEDFFGEPFNHAETPWIVSQDTLPSDPDFSEKQQLFKFATLADGNAANREIKIAIVDIRTSVPGTDYGSFSVIVRAIDDTDRRPNILEQFENVNLDPASPQYIKRVIGDRFSVIDGDTGKVQDFGEYQNNSDYVRVIMDEDFERANEGGRDDLADLVPWGFGNMRIPISFGAGGTGTLPHDVKFRLTQTVTDQDVTIAPGQPIEYTGPGSGEVDTRNHLGFDFEFAANRNFLNPIANNASSPDDFLDFVFDFSLEDADIKFSEVGTDNTVANRKFVVGFQGGFDGQDPTVPLAIGEDISPTNAQGFDLSSGTAPGTAAYESAFNIFANQDEFDINLLVTPGVIASLHPAVVTRGIDMVEGRGDAFYVFDPTPVTATISETTSTVQGFDSNYAGTYYPWLRIQDNETNRIIPVPPSVLMPRVYAFSDRVGEEWFAPAGFNRGGIPEAIEAVTRLTKPERDELYAERVNPIAQYRGDVIVFGQKTLQARPSALDRINVRRLLINVKKFIASTSQFLLFEQNTVETRAQFLNTVNPFLERVQQRAGIFAFRVQMDENNNPPEVIDRNQLVGEIFLQPTRAAEFIVLDFNLLPTGAEFPNDEA